MNENHAHWHVRYSTAPEKGWADGKDFVTFDDAHAFWRQQSGYRRLLIHIEDDCWLDVIPNGFVCMSAPASRAKGRE